MLYRGAEFLSMLDLMKDFVEYAEGKIDIWIQENRTRKWFY